MGGICFIIKTNGRVATRILSTDAFVGKTNKVRAAEKAYGRSCWHDPIPTLSSFSWWRNLAWYRPVVDELNVNGIAEMEYSSVEIAWMSICNLHIKFVGRIQLA
jgi:hypothetical protein